MRYLVQVVYPDGNPQDVAEFNLARDAIEYAEFKRKPEHKGRVAWIVYDKEDPEVDVEAEVTSGD